MIKSVVREHHFTPDVIDAFFIDYESDWHGLEWWYKDVEDSRK
jgi:hypothetical protein